MTKARKGTLALDGDWNGKIRVLRSTNGGEALHPLTAEVHMVKAGLDCFAALAMTKAEK